MKRENDEGLIHEVCHVLTGACELLSNEEEKEDL